MIDSSTWDGVQSLLDNYAAVRSGDTVLLLYTSDSYEAAAWVSASLGLRDIAVRRVWMAPLHDDGFAERLSAAMPPHDAEGRLVVLSFERDTMSHSGVLRRALAARDPARYVVLRTISASAELFATALRQGPGELAARNATILRSLMPAERIRIETPGGSRLVVGLDTRHRWISNRGVARPGGVTVLPPGEVATYPASISGVFVADFALNVNAITDEDVRLCEHPVTVRIEDGRAVDYECADARVRRFLDECFQTHCAYNVGELGFGTNTGVREPIAMNSHINERRPGVHVGFGQHNQDPGVVGYQCAIHLDLIARGGTVWVGDEPLDLDNVVPSAAGHPEGSRDEDVFSPDELEIDDCCGVLTCDGLRLFEPSATR